MQARLHLSMVRQASPFIWGSVEDASSMPFVYQGSPYLVVDGPPGANYVFDALGRVTDVNFTNGNTIHYNYDAAGNRTSVVTAL